MEAKAVRLSREQRAALYVRLAEQAGKAADCLRAIENVRVALGLLSVGGPPPSMFAFLATQEQTAQENLTALGFEQLGRRMVSHG